MSSSPDAQPRQNTEDTHTAFSSMGCDIFISYRQNDNRSGWVTEFVEHLREELAATFKEPVTVYFDENPHDGLLETHNVDKSLKGKLKCLIFIPIISHTYCDPKSFAWQNEFIPFCKMANEDEFGLDVTLPNGNVTSRILPIQIHEIDEVDQSLFENESGGPIRSMNFIFKSYGVNRPILPQDLRNENLNKTFYRDQINKTANAIEGIFKSLQPNTERHKPAKENLRTQPKLSPIQWFWSELLRRNVFRAALAYLVVTLLLHQIVILLTPTFEIEEWLLDLEIWVLGLGFPVAMVFAWFYEASPQGFIRTSSAQSAENPYPPSRKKPLTGGLIITILVVLLASQYVYFNYLKSDILIGTPIKSIAVLPFENRSGDRNDQYLADGITDDIINNLSIISQLKVTNRKDVLPYESGIMPYDRIAKELQVMALLIGSVQRLDDQIIIRAHLINATDNSFIWGNTLHRTTDNIIAVQSEIAKVIADRLQIKLNQLEKERLNKQPTDNPTAYDYYLRGRMLYYKYEAEANDSAILQFKKAITLDPKYARAWAGLGDAYSQMNIRFSRGSHWIDSSQMAGQKAIALDSNLSEAYKALANAYNYKKQYDKAYPLLVKSVELNSTNEKAVGNLGTNFLLRGDLPKALQWEKKAVGMDPNNWIPYQIIGWIYRLLDDLEQAESWLKRSMELEPKAWDTYELLGYINVVHGKEKEALDLIPTLLKYDSTDSRALEVAGLISHYAGDASKAKKYYQLSIENNPSYKDDEYTVSPIGLGQILFKERNFVDADVYLSRAMTMNLEEIKSGSQNMDAPFYVSAVHAIRNNREQSLLWLQKAIDAHWVDYNKVLHGPWFENFKTDPAFLNKIDSLKKKVSTMREEAAQY